MSTAPQIRLLDEGRPKWFSQRPAPFTNCMFAAVCVPLSFMGYDLPDDFVHQLRVASGVDKHRATNTAATQRALRRLIPECPIQFGALDEHQMLRRIAAEEIVVRVMVRAAQLPQPLTHHFSPSFMGRHAVALTKARPLPDGDFEVLYLDPMGTPVSGYDGTLIRFSSFAHAVLRTPDSKIQATFGEKNAALPERPDEVNRGGTGTVDGNALPAPVAGAPVILTHGRPDEFARVPRGTAFLHPTTLAVVTRAVDAGDFRLAGRSIDGRFAGVWVNTRKIPKAKGMTLLLVEHERIGVPFIDS